MPFSPLPTKPMWRDPWGGWGDAMDRVVRELARAVEALQAGGTGGGRDPFVKPASATSWPKQTRTTPPGTLMWLRNWSPTVLAPIPTAADGYLPGDLVYPVAAGDTLPGTGSPTGTLYSDSLDVPVTVDLTGRYGDHALGGADPAWMSDTSAGTESRTRVQPGSGLEVYSRAVAYVAAPKLPASNLRYSLRIMALEPNNEFAVVLRGTSYSSADTVRIAFRRDATASTLLVKAVDRTAGSEVVTNLGTAPFVPGGAVTVTIVGSTVTVQAGATTLPTYTLPTGAVRLAVFALAAGWYSSVSVRDVKVDVL